MRLYPKCRICKKLMLRAYLPWHRHTNFHPACLRTHLKQMAFDSVAKRNTTWAIHYLEAEP